MGARIPGVRVAGHVLCGFFIGVFKGSIVGALVQPLQTHAEQRAHLLQITGVYVSALLSQTQKGQPQRLRSCRATELLTLLGP